MRVRLVIGIVLLLVGGVWFFQGIDVLGGSGMSGETFWAVAGAIVALLGLRLVWSVRRGRPAERP
jgi:hypothetical protein